MIDGIKLFQGLYLFFNKYFVAIPVLVAQGFVSELLPNLS
jgi:hypothetical protein